MLQVSTREKTENIEQRDKREAAIDASDAIYGEGRGRFSAKPAACNEKRGAKIAPRSLSFCTCERLNFASELRFVRVNRLLQARLRLDADEAVHDFAILKNHERWNAAHAVALCRMRGVVHVQLADFDRALILASQL